MDLLCSDSFSRLIRESCDIPKASKRFLKSKISDIQCRTASRTTNADEDPDRPRQDTALLSSQIIILEHALCIEKLVETTKIIDLKVTILTSEHPCTAAMLGARFCKILQIKLRALDFLAVWHCRRLEDMHPGTCLINPICV